MEARGRNDLPWEPRVKVAVSAETGTQAASSPAGHCDGRWHTGVPPEGFLQRPASQHVGLCAGPASPKAMARHQSKNPRDIKATDPQLHCQGQLLLSGIIWNSPHAARQHPVPGDPTTSTLGTPGVPCPPHKATPSPTTASARPNLASQQRPSPAPQQVPAIRLR